MKSVFTMLFQSLSLAKPSMYLYESPSVFYSRGIHFTIFLRNFIHLKESFPCYMGLRKCLVYAGKELPLLSKYIFDEKYIFEPAQVKIVAKQLLTAVATLHENNIVHGALNPGN
jgi:serine/threonine protein kinase